SSFGQSQGSFYLCVFKMAACSEQEIDGKLSTDFCSNFPVSPVPIQNSELFIKNSRTSERILSEKVSSNESIAVEHLEPKTFLLESNLTTRMSGRTEAAVRKGKKGRNHTEETVKLARHIEGNRGDDSIDSLVAFICSEDKRRASKGPNNGLDRKLKTPQRRARHPPRERSGGDEEEEEEKERPFSPSFYSDQGAEPEEPLGRLDVSSYSDVDQVQEEFRLVTKKQRRRGQLKEAASRRPPLCPASARAPPAPPRGDSTPPSEPSSPENSDLDSSVNSVPVGGRSPGDAPTSYADVARLSCKARERPPRPQTTPAVVLLDDVSSLPAPLGEITFGFDVNEQLVRMTLDGQLCCVPSPEERAVPAAAASLGRFNYADVVDFLDSAWNRAFQSCKRAPPPDAAGGNSTGCAARTSRYYCDATTPARPTDS
ncbi:unnamed protein product, partial [Ixodes hexagonus]